MRKSLESNFPGMLSDTSKAVLPSLLMVVIFKEIASENILLVLLQTLPKMVVDVDALRR